MKKVVSLFLSMLLLSSCYSYKQIDMSKESLAIGKRYKLYKLDDKNIKGKLRAVTDTTITVSRYSGKKEVIQLDEITYVKKGKFSVLKTLGIPTGAYAFVVLVALLTWNGPNIGTINFN